MIRESKIHASLEDCQSIMVVVFQMLSPSQQKYVKAMCMTAASMRIPMLQNLIYLLAMVPTANEFGV